MLAERLRAGPPSGVLDMLPYAALLGLTYERVDGELVVTMPYGDTLVGQPFPPRLHGGTVAGLMEITATAALLVALPRDAPLPALKPVSVTVDYLRAGAPHRGAGPCALGAHARVGAGRASARALESLRADHRRDRDRQEPARTLHSSRKRASARTFHRRRRRGVHERAS